MGFVCLIVLVVLHFFFSIYFKLDVPMSRPGAKCLHVNKQVELLYWNFDRMAVLRKTDNNYLTLRL